MNGPKATQMKGLLAASILMNAVAMFILILGFISSAELAINRGLLLGLGRVMNDEVCMWWRHYLGRRSYV